MILNKDFYPAESPSGFEQPLSHTHIGHDNILESGNFFGSTEQAGFEASALENPFTYEFWKPTAFPATITAQLSESKLVNYVGIAGHNLSGCLVEVQYSLDGGSNWENASEFSVLEDKPLMVVFSEIFARDWRVRLTGYSTFPTASLDFAQQVFKAASVSASDTGGARISVLYLGQVLAMDRPIYAGITPPNLSRRTQYRTQISEGGQWLGRSIVRNGVNVNISIQHLPAAWYRNKFDPFAIAARTKPFFVLWRPYGYADEAAFAFTSSDISPQNMGVRDYLSVSFSATGLGYDE